MQNKIIFCINRRAHSAFNKERVKFVMKVSAFIISAVMFTGQMLLATPGNGQGNDQTVISLNFKNTPIQKVFAAIENKADVVIMYENTGTLKNEKVTIAVKDKKVADVLDELLKGKALKWNIRENVIRVEATPPASDKTEQPSVSLNRPVPNAEPQTIEPITGKVTDSSGAPLAGASVRVKGSNKGTNTNAKGEFTIEAEQGDVLVISFVGFQNREVSVGNGNLMVALKAAESALDEIQVVAYGQTTRRLQTGNVSTVKAKDIEKQPVQNPLLALQGRVPGLVVEQATGLPGSGVKVRIQGQNSLSMGNDPLYVIDGVPYPSQMLPTINSTLGSSGNTSPTPAGSGNPLSFINPADIESIDVLKDADATSIYGSRAAAGAILITTKKGKAGPTKVNANFQTGWGKVIRKLNLLNTQQYLEMRKEAFQNDGRPLPSIATAPNDLNYDLNGTWDTTRYTDWQKELIGGTAKYTDAQVSVSGGTANTNFLVGGNYHRETTVLPGDLVDQKGSVHFSINSVSSNQKFRIQLQGSYMTDENKIIITDLTTQAVQLAPNAPALYQADGTLNWALLPDGRSTWTNPLSGLKRKYNLKTDNLIGNLNIGYEILDGLEIKTSLGYSKLTPNEVSIFPKASTAPELTTFTGFSNFGNGSISTWQIEPQITYNHDLAGGTLSAIIGSTILETMRNRQAFFASGFNSDAVLEDIRAASTVTVSSTTASVYRYNALFGRVTYNQKNKYLLNLSARRDGSSRFGPKDQFHNFTSVGAAWIFSNEKLIQKALPFLSFGKIRASYGTTGNDQIGDYAFMNLYESRPQQNNYQGIVGVQPINLPNPYLQWEETKKIQVGLDLGFSQDRILMTANYYDNRSSNQLQNFTLPITTGFGAITQNFPATIKNFGWEFTLSTINVQNQIFKWTTNINITIPRNKLLKYPGLESSSRKDFLVVGKPINILKLYQSAGIDPATGLYQFYDKSGNLTSDPGYGAENKIIIIDTDPKYYGGIQNNIGYKGLELSFLFQFFKQIGPNYHLGYQPGTFTGTGSRGNQPVTVLDRWQKPGDNSTIQKVTSFFWNYPSTEYADGSTLAYSDASYIRLKNVSLSWQLPNRWYNNAKIQNIRVYAQGQNLLTFTNYIGLDPETKSSTTLPPLSVFTLGLQIGL